MQPRQLLRILASSLLLILSFPRPEIGLFSLFAFVPLVSILSNSGIKRAFLSGWCAGTVWFFFSYHWVSHSVTEFGNIPLPVAEAVILLLAGTHGLYVGLFSIMIPLVSGGKGMGVGEYRSMGDSAERLTPLPPYPHSPILHHLITPLLVLPSAWVLLEVARSWLPAPFPWLLLGTAARKIPFSISLFEVLGVYGVSGWIMAVNVLIWMVVSNFRRMRRQAGVVLAVVLLMPVIMSPINTQGTGQRLRVGIVQGNFGQEHKWEESLREETLDTYLTLTDKAVEKGAQIIVWPETAVPTFYQAEPELIERLENFTISRGIHLIFGSPGYEISGREVRLYNRVYHLMPDGNESYYDKSMLVPFGEYVPFAELIPFVDKMVPGEGEFARGHWGGPFQTPVPSGALVCFEISFPSLSRREVGDGALFLVNVTNDAWFGRSWGPYQHLAVSAVRAMENGVPVLRAANTGISAIIDRRGRLIRSVPLEEKGIIVADIDAAHGQTLYTRFGDWIVILCAAVLSLYFLLLLNAWRSARWTA